MDGRKSLLETRADLIEKILLIDDKIWGIYITTRHHLARNAIMLRHLGYVENVAKSLHAKLPRDVDIQDLIQAGSIGLADAVSKFEPYRGLKFSTYAAARIRGQMLDFIREMDWCPRLVRSRTKKYAAATEVLNVRLGRAPNEEELAKEMKVAIKDVPKVLKDSAAVQTVSLSRKWFETDSGNDIREVDLLVDKSSPASSTDMDRAETIEVLTRGMDSTKRSIFILYFFESMTMKEIGKTVGVSESRVSQIMTNLKERIKAKYTEAQFRELVMSK